MKILFILVEGFYDIKFFENLYPQICDIIGGDNIIKIIPYQQKKNKKKFVNGIIKGALNKNNKYLFISDYDSKNGWNSLDERKKRIVEYFKELEDSKVVIVKEEIESWYFSGLTDKSLLFDTENLTYYCSKEEFWEVLPEGKLTINFAVDAMKTFDIDLAIKNNESFRYFIQKLQKITL